MPAPVHWCGLANVLASVGWCGQAGATVDVRDQAHKTASLFACENGHFDIAVLLHSHGASLAVCDYNGMTPLLAACMGVSQPSHHAVQGFQHGANNRDLRCVSKLLCAKHVPNSKSLKKWPPFLFMTGVSGQPQHHVQRNQQLVEHADTADCLAH